VQNAHRMTLKGEHAENSRQKCRVDGKQDA
jgi:hypothetical protein